MTENIVVTNRKARRDYTILDSVEAGIVLKGTEIKSLRLKQANLNDSFASFQKGELYLHNCHINPYEFGNINNVDPVRERKLLLHKKEILKIFAKIREKGYTLIPLRIYIKKGYAKVELGMAKGKRQFDKREDIKRKEAKREIDRALSSKR